MPNLSLPEFRQALDALSEALSTPVRRSQRWVPEAEMSRLKVSLTQLLSLMNTSELETKRALLGMPVRARHSRSAEFVTTLESITQSLRAHFGAFFDEASLDQLRHLLAFPSPDFLNVLGRADDRIAIQISSLGF